MTGLLASATALSAHAAAMTGYGAVAGITIGLGIPLVIGASVALIVASYYRLQRHRADAVAMAAYRKLAEEAVTNQQELRAQLEKLTEHVRAVEHLMREVG